jgi:hypothetical protein
MLSLVTRETTGFSSCLDQDRDVMCCDWVDWPFKDSSPHKFTESSLSYSSQWLKQNNLPWLTRLPEVDCFTGGEK